MSTLERLALLTDAEAVECLNGLLKGRAASDQTFASVIQDQNDLKEVVAAVAADSKFAPATIAAKGAEEQARATRFILAECATNAMTASIIENWLDSNREKLIEPVTTALILAGIVFVLSTDISIKYEGTGAKRHLKVEIRKKPTATALLKKFFSFLGVGS